MNNPLNQLRQLVQLFACQKIADNFGGFTTEAIPKGELWVCITPHNDVRRSVGSITSQRLDSLKEYKGGLYLITARDEILIGEGDRLVSDEVTYVALENGRLEGNFQTVFAAKR